MHLQIPTSIFAALPGIEFILFLVATLRMSTASDGEDGRGFA
jgi:hypothetical protein